MGITDLKYKASMKKITIFSNFLVIFLMLGSTIAMATPTSSEQSATPKLTLAPEDPQFVKDQNDKLSDQSESVGNGHKTGFKHGPLDRSHISSVSVPKSVQASFPISYDLRTFKRVTPVKDQGGAGVCWAFATYGSLESNLKPVNWSFSENNMKNLLSSDYSEGFDRGAKDGGNEFMSTAYLARWDGPVNTSDDPYSDSSSYAANELGLPIQKHVQNVSFLPDRTNSLDNANIKSAIMNSGAVFTTMYYRDGSYSPAKHSYYYNGRTQANHAVTIVGWDDNYKNTNFVKINGRYPSGNGAFIVKNSWGTNWGEQGYFYVSYYDSYIGKGNAVFTGENTDNYQNNYQYDPLGWVTNVGYSNPTAWCANVFTANAKENLKAVSFYTSNSNTGYTISVYNDITGSNVKGTTPASTVTGSIPFAGYHTIALNPGVSLNPSQKFSVVLKITTPNYNYPIPIESPYPGFSSKATANPGESFISYDGNAWQDITTINGYSNTNVCIKAFSNMV